MSLLLVEFGTQTSKFLRILRLLVTLSCYSLPFPLLVVEPNGCQVREKSHMPLSLPLSMLLLPSFDILVLRLQELLDLSTMLQQEKSKPYPLQAREAIPEMFFVN